MTKRKRKCCEKQRTNTVVFLPFWSYRPYYSFRETRKGEEEVDKGNVTSMKLWKEQPTGESFYRSRVGGQEGRFIAAARPKSRRQVDIGVGSAKEESPTSEWNANAAATYQDAAWLTIDWLRRVGFTVLCRLIGSSVHRRSSWIYESESTEILILSEIEHSFGFKCFVAYVDGHINALMFTQ